MTNKLILNRLILKSTAWRTASVTTTASATAKILLCVVLFCVFPLKAEARTNVALKSNLLYDATATANLGMEVSLARKWSLDLSGNLNVWSFSEGKRWKHWLCQPELRYWTCSNMGGHFFAFHLLGGQYNIGQVNLDFLKFLGKNFEDFKDYRHQGWYAGAGIGYGYSWILSRHWNIEVEVAAGYIYSNYSLYECAGCGKKVKTDLKNSYFGPTKLALDLIYVF